jgi:protocatechuate 3,4-dioxygenase, alpha subunit
MLHRLVTRVYFPDEATGNAADPVLRDLDPAERALLTALPQPDGTLRFDIRLQAGADGPETPFFAV